MVEVGKFPDESEMHGEVVDSVDADGADVEPGELMIVSGDLSDGGVDEGGVCGGVHLEGRLCGGGRLRRSTWVLCARRRGRRGRSGGGRRGGRATGRDAEDVVEGDGEGRASVVAPERGVVLLWVEGGDVPLR